MRAVALVAALSLVACQSPTGAPSPVTDAPHTRHTTHAPNGPTPPVGPFVGHLVDGGDWIPLIGDAIPMDSAYYVVKRYVFVDSTGRDTVRVAKVDSAAYYNAPLPNDPPGSLGARDQTKDCLPELILACPPSAWTTYIGEYLVTVETAARVQGQFELYVYPP